MLKLVNGLVDSASSDAEVRQKIANLPQTVSDASGLKKIRGKVILIKIFYRSHLYMRLGMRSNFR